MNNLNEEIEDEMDIILCIMYTSHEKITVIHVHRVLCSIPLGQISFMKYLEYQKTALTKYTMIILNTVNQIR